MIRRWAMILVAAVTVGAAATETRQQPASPGTVPMERGVSFPVWPGPVAQQLRVINQCSWAQAVTWGNGATIAPAGSAVLRGDSGESGNPGAAGPGQRDSRRTYFSHRATLATGSVTKECSANRFPQFEIEWVAPEIDPATGLPVNVGPQLLEPIEVVLTETSTTTTTTTTTNVPPTATAPHVPTGVTVGLDAVGTFSDCTPASDCLPLDDCVSESCGTTGTYSLTDGFDNAFQAIGAETVRVRIEITPQQAAAPQRRDLNFLGLLSNSVSEFVEWWMPTLHAAENMAQSGLQKGLQFLMSSQGGSTGKILTMQVLNFTGKPVNLQGMLALEPLKKDAQQKITQAFSKLAGRQIPTKIDLNGYCLEFLKLPPIAGQVLKVAGPEVQKRFAPMKKVMTAANSLMQKGQLKPDSNPASYADSIKQWAIWSVEQKFNDKTFAEAFMGHTRKNVEGAGQKWSRQIEDVVRQRIPNRWQDIVQILNGAGAAVPQ